MGVNLEIQKKKAAGFFIMVCGVHSSVLTKICHADE
jgi:hypothetical protein